MDDDLSLKLKNLKPERLEKLLKEIFSFFLSFLESISEEEDKMLGGKMDDFIKEAERIIPEGQAPQGIREEEKWETINFLLESYREKLFSSLTEDNKKAFNEGVGSIIEKNLL